MHYSQQQAEVLHEVTDSHSGLRYLDLRMRGLITAALLKAQLQQWNEGFDKKFPPYIMLDLIEASGYGPGASAVARDWIMEAADRNIEAIAVLGSSAVLRTAVLILSHDLGVDIRCHPSKEDAIEWLMKKHEARPSSPVQIDPEA